MRCFHCKSKYLPKKSWQHFCTTACQVLHNNNVNRYDVKNVRRELLTLRHENSELKARLARRKAA